MPTFSLSELRNCHDACVIIVACFYVDLVKNVLCDSTRRFGHEMKVTQGMLSKEYNSFYELRQSFV